MSITWKTLDISISETAKERIVEIMESYPEDKYCPMLSYGSDVIEGNGKKTEIWRGWRVVANDFEGLKLAPMFFDIDGVKIYIASLQKIEPGSTLEFRGGEFFFDRAI